MVCRLQGHAEWVSGVVHAVDETTAADQIHPRRAAIVHVMLDAPDGLGTNGGTNKLVAVPEDACHLQRSATSPRSVRSVLVAV